MAPPISRARAARFAQSIEGTWGEFVTPGGRISYLMTNARLGLGDADPERRLTERLRPVREVLDLREMEFSQLLQRDLDDHRVATEMVPYLLNRTAAAPAFFPPILAVLLPFDPTGGAGQFPAAGRPTTKIDDDEMPWREQSFGRAFRVRRLAEGADADALNETRLGELAWNEELAKVVVLDGQHRAMALLAIQRTVMGSWEEQGRGARYRHFYESRIRDLITGLDEEALGSIRVPVTVCWFPDLSGPDHEPHKAARKLFVDVNREARPPSRDRVVLLDDTDLLNIFTRSTLDGLRAQDSRPPLHAIEYDRSQNASALQRWPAISSLSAIRSMINHVVFGPERYLSDVTAAMRGRTAESDAFTRRQLRVTELFRANIPTASGSFEREALGRTDFPSEAQEALEAEFADGWGSALMTMLGELTPFREHYDALEELAARAQPLDVGTAEALANEAIFGTGGLFWTLRTSSRHQVTAGSEIGEAWQIVEQRGREFRMLRSERLLARQDNDAVVTANGLYDVFATQACQTSLALLLGTLAIEAGVAGAALPEFAGELVRCLNNGLTERPYPDRMPRVVALANESDLALNRIQDMNVPRAVEFRYFWLEFLSLESSLNLLPVGISGPRVRELRDQSRRRYLRQLIDEGITQRRRLNRQLTRAQLEIPVTSSTMARLEESLSYWFEVSPESFRTWAQESELVVAPELPDDELDL